MGDLHSLLISERFFGHQVHRPDEPWERSCLRLYESRCQMTVVRGCTKTAEANLKRRQSSAGMHGLNKPVMRSSGRGWHGR